MLMTFPSNPFVVAISFRTKAAGWKNYYMEIKVK